MCRAVAAVRAVLRYASMQDQQNGTITNPPGTRPRYRTDRAMPYAVPPCNAVYDCRSTCDAKRDRWVCHADELDVRGGDQRGIPLQDLQDAVHKRLFGVKIPIGVRGPDGAPHDDGRVEAANGRGHCEQLLRHACHLLERDMAGLLFGEPPPPPGVVLRFRGTAGAEENFWSQLRGAECARENF